MIQVQKPFTITTTSWNLRLRLAEPVIFTIGAFKQQVEVTGFQVYYRPANEDEPASSEVWPRGYYLTKKGQRRKGADVDYVWSVVEGEGYEELESAALDYVLDYVNAGSGITLVRG